jgi:hypothetical protein
MRHPAWLIGSATRLGRIRPSAEIQVGSELYPDPFDVAQGRGEHGRTTIKTFGGEDFKTKLITAEGQLGIAITSVRRI